MRGASVLLLINDVFSELIWVDIGLSEFQFRQMVKDNWELTLKLEIYLDREEPTANSPKYPFVTAYVSVKGPVRVALMLDCALPLVKLAAGQFFDVKDEELTQTQIKDAVAEMINIIGGALVHHMGGEYELGLPKVSNARGQALTIPEAKLICKDKFRCADLPFSVAIVELTGPQ